MTFLSIFNEHNNLTTKRHMSSASMGTKAPMNRGSNSIRARIAIPGDIFEDYSLFGTIFGLYSIFTSYNVPTDHNYG